MMLKEMGLRFLDDARGSVPLKFFSWKKKCVNAFLSHLSLFIIIIINIINLSIRPLLNIFAQSDTHDYTSIVSPVTTM